MDFYQDKFKILNQSVDTLKVSFKSVDEYEYQHKYLKFLDELEKYKLEAQATHGENTERFVTKELLGLGLFKIYAVGNRRFKYRIENDDVNVFFSNIKFENKDAVHVKVDFKASFLFAKGHVACYKLAEILVNKVLAKHMNKVSEIHLATDVVGFDFDAFDLYRFRYQCSLADFDAQEFAHFGSLSKKKKGLDRFTTEIPITQRFMGGSRSGYSFGKGNFMMRVYDKTKQIKLHQEAAYIEQRWIENGYKCANESSIQAYEKVWRHEVQYRREELIRKFGKKDCKNEVEYFFSILPVIWRESLERIRYIPLSEDEVLRVMKNPLSSSRRTIFLRAQEKERFNYWDVIKVWNMQMSDSAGGYLVVKEQRKEHVFRQIQSAISAAMKYASGDADTVGELLYECNSRLQDMKGINLVQNGILNIVGSFAEKERQIREKGAVDEMGFKGSFDAVCFEMMNNFHNLSVLEQREDYQQYVKSLEKGGYKLPHSSQLSQDGVMGRRRELDGDDKDDEDR